MDVRMVKELIAAYRKAAGTLADMAERLDQYVVAVMSVDEAVGVMMKLQFLDLCAQRQKVDTVADLLDGAVRTAQITAAARPRERGAPW